MKMLTWGACVVCVCVLRTIIIDISSGDARNAEPSHLDITNIPATLRPPACPDGSPQHSTPTHDMCPFDEDKLIPVSAVAGGGGISPLPVFTLGLLALLWVWVLDEAMLPARLRRRTFGTAGPKGGCRYRCRCRVCTLRIQAQGQPLHDVRNVA
jgi:hypothetical protein